MNQKEKRELLLQTGYAIEIVGNVTLAAAAVFGYLSAFIVLATVANRNADESSHSHSHNSHHHSNHSRSYTSINFFFNTPFCHTRCSDEIDLNDFYKNLLISSILPSILGIVLGVCCQVTWVAITVAALWASAALISAAGRAIIDYALHQPDEEIQAPLNTEDDTKGKASFKTTNESIIHPTPGSHSFEQKFGVQTAIPIADNADVPYAQYVEYYRKPWLAKQLSGETSAKSHNGIR